MIIITRTLQHLNLNVPLFQLELETFDRQQRIKASRSGEQYCYVVDFSVYFLVVV